MEQLVAVDITAKDYKDVPYQGRIVAAAIDDRWYALPRCRSSRSFYEAADRMTLPTPTTDDSP